MTNGDVRELPRRSAIIKNGMCTIPKEFIDTIVSGNLCDLFESIDGSNGRNLDRLKGRLGKFFRGEFFRKM